MLPKFPISISDKVIKDNPNFTALLTEIGTFIDTDGISRELKRELQNSALTLERNKRNYFESEVLLQCTEDLLLDWRLNSEFNHNDLSEVQRQVIENGYQMVEAEQLTKLGLLTDSNADFYPTVAVLDADSADCLVSALEGQMQRLIDDLVAHTTSDINMKRTMLGTDQLKALISLVEKTSHDSKQDCAQIENAYAMINRMTIEYIKVLKRTSQTIDQMLEQFKLDQQVQKEQITIKWLQHRAQTVLKKLNVIQQQILTNTYTQHSVAGFKQIKAILEKTIHSSSHELRQIVRQLDAYGAAGLGFDRLVAQYASVQNQIRDKSWALKELVNTNSAMLSPNSTWDQ